MKRMVLALVLVLAMAVPVFAQVTISPNQSGGVLSNKEVEINAPIAQATANGGSVGNVSAAGGNVNSSITNKDIGNVTIGGGILSSTLSPSAKAEAEQKQQQKQGQIQGQVNVNDQTIAPEQKVVFKSPTQLLGSPSQGLSELNFGNGRLKDATRELPRFAMYAIKALTDEAITEVISVNANVKFKNLYKAILSDAKDVAGDKSFKSSEVRYQVIRAEAQKSWTTGGNFGGAGSGLAASGLGGGSGAGSIIPQWGGTKADDLFTIIFVRVYTGK